MYKFIWHYTIPWLYINRYMICVSVSSGGEYGFQSVYGIWNNPRLVWDILNPVHPYYGMQFHLSHVFVGWEYLSLEPEIQIIRYLLDILCFEIINETVSTESQWGHHSFVHKVCRLKSGVPNSSSRKMVAAQTMDARNVCIVVGARWCLGPPCIALSGTNGVWALSLLCLHHMGVTLTEP